MSKVSGHGGYIIREGAPSVRIENSEYSVEIMTMIDDVTDSGSGGVAEGLPIIYKVQAFEFSVAEDDVNFPFALGITEGQVISLFLRRGSVAQFDKITNTIVRSSRVTNPQDKARRVQITCEYGSLARGVAAPAGFS